MSEHTVLFARRYEFTSPETGQILSGVKITYLDQPDNTKDSKGLPVLTISAPLEFWHDLRAVPGKYELGFRHKMDSKTNKPVVILTDLTYVESAVAA